MPRYHFDVAREPYHQLRDQEGRELPDLEAARREAVRSLLDWARHEFVMFRDGAPNASITLRDAEGRELLRATLNLKVEALDRQA